jgi:hypothetical protein
MSGARHNMRTRQAVTISNRQPVGNRFSVSQVLRGQFRAMEEYRAYVIGPDGHIINRVDVRCFDEKEARRLAKIAVDGHAVELWQADRFIERFEPG